MTTATYNPASFDHNLFSTSPEGAEYDMSAFETQAKISPAERHYDYEDNIPGAYETRQARAELTAKMLAGKNRKDPKLAEEFEVLRGWHAQNTQMRIEAMRAEGNLTEQQIAMQLQQEADNDYAIVQQLLTKEAGIAGKIGEFYANLSPAKKMAVMVVATTGIILTGGVAALGGAIGVGGAVVGVGGAGFRAGRAYAVQMAKLYDRDSRMKIRPPKGKVSVENADVFDHIRANGEKTRRNAVKWALGSAALAGVSGILPLIDIAGSANHASADRPMFSLVSNETPVDLDDLSATSSDSLDSLSAASAGDLDSLSPAGASLDSLTTSDTSDALDSLTEDSGSELDALTAASDGADLDSLSAADVSDLDSLTTADSGVDSQDSLTPSDGSSLDDLTESGSVNGLDDLTPTDSGSSLDDLTTADSPGLDDLTTADSGLDDLTTVGENTQTIEAALNINGNVTLSEALTGKLGLNGTEAANVLQDVRDNLGDTAIGNGPNSGLPLYHVEGTPSWDLRVSNSGQLPLNVQQAFATAIQNRGYALAA